ERELDVLVFDLHGRMHARRDRLGLLEAPFDAREVLQNGVREAFAEAANGGRAEAVDVGGVRAAPPQAAERLEDDRWLPDTARPRPLRSAGLRVRWPSIPSGARR